MKLCLAILVLFLFIVIFRKFTRESFLETLEHTKLEGNYFKYLRGESIYPIFSKKFIEEVDILIKYVKR